MPKKPETEDAKDPHSHLYAPIYSAGIRALIREKTEALAEIVGEKWDDPDDAPQEMEEVFSELEELMDLFFK